MKRSLLVKLLLSLALLFTMAGCGDPPASVNESVPERTASQPPTAPAGQWDEHVSQHSDGVLSRTSALRIRFVHPVIEEKRVGDDAASYLTLTPAVAAKVRFTSTREIVLEPTDPLVSGRRYEVTLNPVGLLDIPASMGLFSFDIQVKRQGFGISAMSLEVDPKNADRYLLSGTLTTEDSADAGQVEQLIEAQSGGKALATTWVHGADGRVHDFLIQGITRAEQESEVVVRWAGVALGVDNSGERRVSVPALGVFATTSVRMAQDERGYVQVIFSEALDRNQNLNGLIRLEHAGDSSFSTSIDGNQLKIYPQPGLTGELKLTLEAGIKAASGRKLATPVNETLDLAPQQPAVRFAGKGVILPANDRLTVPIEAVNVRSLQVTAVQVFADNLGQFLQVNQLDGEAELKRVGRALWRKKIELDAPSSNVWTRYALDLGELLKQHPGSLFRLTLSVNRGDSTYQCSDEENQVALPEQPELSNREDMSYEESSSWDYAEQYYNPDEVWEDRSNPCKDAFYMHSAGVRDSRNFIASNLGLIAKRGESGGLHVVVTDLREATPLTGVSLKVMNFQGQTIAEGSSDDDGFANIALNATPFYLQADYLGERGYLKLSKGSALPTSHFDVGGERVKRGLKGIIYGERGVWRPGDKMHLTFVLQDRNDTIPADHPVTLQLFNPSGVMVQSLTNSEPVGDFYAFTLRTDEDAPTGNWRVKAILGGSEFSRTLKVEMVMPNRLKMALDFGDEVLYHSDKPLHAKLTAQWLHGAKAANLKADVSLRLSPRTTQFERFTEHSFDDPARSFSGEEQMLFEGVLDEEGVVEFDASVEVNRKYVAGMLNAHLLTRVFEQGGAFSSASESRIYHPFERYVGLKLPKGDAARGMLLTDIDHEVSIATLDAHGRPLAVSGLEVSLYKIDWKWWWDKSGESLARYARSSHHNRLQEGTVSTGKDGLGSWKFQIQYPQWGRYLVRVCDPKGGHCSGKIVYIDWPGWAGRAQEGGGSGANVLTLATDKPAYQVGEEALLQLPATAKGRALLTIESGSRIIAQRWLQLSPVNSEADATQQVVVPITAAMAPNVYLSVTLLQPHRERENDRPIRLYGITPLSVTDPATHLQPTISVAEEIRPNSSVEVVVSEAQGRAMSYTLALVDEGLLGLTNFKTPDLHRHFYTKEALGVTSWDLYDLVVGAYGGELETLLALGGSDDADNAEANKKRRFPPVVRFLGPFHLAAGHSATHEVEIPNYIGALRAMLVAAEQGAYGLDSKEVLVREPLSMLTTLPRVVRADEELEVPVSLFAYLPGIEQAELSVEVDDHFSLVGEGKTEVRFSGPGEEIGLLRLKVGSKLGKGRLLFTAKAGEHEAHAEVFLDILGPNPITQRYQRFTLEPGQQWQTRIQPHGLEGTNRSVLEISSAPPIDLDRRLQYLIRYPHGCVEQTISSVFPQLALPLLVTLDKTQQEGLQRNIGAGIERLRSFQLRSGGFSYWAGNADADDWGSSYAGHFLLEAKNAGYYVPSEMLSDWRSYQKRIAQGWTTGSDHSILTQAYRLYTLALAGEPQMGAMNRLREQPRLDSVSARMLASAYQLGGLPAAANDLLESHPLKLRSYQVEGDTYGSRLRDRAIALDALRLSGDSVNAKSMADAIARALSSDDAFNTQALAFSLNAMARFIGADPQAEPYRFSYQLDGAEPVEAENHSPYYRTELAEVALDGSGITLDNRSERTLYATLISSGVAPAGEEQESMHDLSLRVVYEDLAGNRVDPSRLIQGSDIKVSLMVTNNSQRQLDNLALSHLVAAGWEIHNPRLSSEEEPASEIDHQDIRDDRIYTYFSLKPDQSKIFSVMMNAAYRGRFYQPAIGVEAMYDASRHARITGQWVEVVKAGAAAQTQPVAEPPQLKN